MKIIFSIFLCLFLTPSFSVFEATASPILWSEAVVNLDTLAFTTTGDLNVSFANSTPRGTLVSRDEIFQEDIGEWSHSYGGIKYNYAALPGDTLVYKSWDLTSTGSGVLKIGLDFFWEFNALPGYEPDMVFGGPDNVVVSVGVNGVGLAHYQLNAPSFDWHSGRYISLSSMPDYYFEAGQITSLEIYVWTNANGLWIEKPNTSAPVPEPSTIVLFGSSMVGLAAIGRRRRN